MRTLLAAFALCIMASGATADCMFQGTLYPEGTVIGGLVCKEGRWVRP